VAPTRSALADDLRRIDSARTIWRSASVDSGCVRSGRCAFGRQDETGRPEAARRCRLSGRWRMRWPVHRQHDGDRKRTSWNLADGFEQYPGDRSEKARERVPGRATCGRFAEAEFAAEPDNHKKGD